MSNRQVNRFLINLENYLNANLHLITDEVMSNVSCNIIERCKTGRIFTGLLITETNFPLYFYCLTVSSSSSSSASDTEDREAVPVVDPEVPAHITEVPAQIVEPPAIHGIVPPQSPQGAALPQLGGAVGEESPDTDMVDSRTAEAFIRMMITTLKSLCNDELRSANMDRSYWLDYRFAIIHTICISLNMKRDTLLVLLELAANEIRQQPIQEEETQYRAELQIAI